MVSHADGTHAAMPSRADAATGADMRDRRSGYGRSRTRPSSADAVKRKSAQPSPRSCRIDEPVNRTWPVRCWRRRRAALTQFRCRGERRRLGVKTSGWATDDRIWRLPRSNISLLISTKPNRCTADGEESLACVITGQQKAGRRTTVTVSLVDVPMSGREQLAIWRRRTRQSADRTPMTAEASRTRKQQVTITKGIRRGDGCVQLRLLRPDVEVAKHTQQAPGRSI